MSITNARRILIAPLDWGLGHTARCVPIIQYILQKGHIPIVAGNTGQCSFIEKSFKGIDFIHLDGYEVSYAKGGLLSQARIFSQLPRIQQVIKQEHLWLLEKAKALELDGIISDNRYGLYHKEMPSVIITHQPAIKTGLGQLPDKAVRKIHYRYLERFQETWIVDMPGDNNLSGALSHPHALPQHAKYIGLLSRFQDDAKSNPTNGSLVILLSGPEPQRTLLSAILWRQAMSHPGKVIFIEGNEDIATPPFIPSHITYHKRLAHSILEPILANADIVICRSGYSTIMDLTALGKKAILIPTPGQTEQEYLGQLLYSKKIFYCAPQKRFDLEKAIQVCEDFPFNKFTAENAFSAFHNVLNSWLERL